MATDPYDEILNRAQRELNPGQQRKLAEELSKRSETTRDSNGDRSLYDVLDERGQIGSITDAPPDLSTNPKHMEGFGQDAR